MPSNRKKKKKLGNNGVKVKQKDTIVAKDGNISWFLNQSLRKQERKHQGTSGRKFRQEAGPLLFL